MSEKTVLKTIFIGSLLSATLVLAVSARIVTGTVVGHAEARTTAPPKFLFKQLKHEL